MVFLRQNDAYVAYVALYTILESRTQQFQLSKINQDLVKRFDLHGNNEIVYPTLGYNFRFL